MRVRTFLQTTACVLFATWLCAAPVTAKGARAPKVRVRPRLAVDLSGAVSSGTVVLPFALEGAGKPSSLRLHWRHLGETAWTDLVVGTGRAWLASIEARGSVEFWAEAAVGAQAVTFGSAEKPVLLVLTPTDSVAPVLSLRNTERLPGSTRLVFDVHDDSRVERVRLGWRPFGTEGWSEFALPGCSDGLCESTVPSRGDFELWATAWDEHGNGPGRLGSAERPLFVPVDVQRPAPQVTPARWPRVVGWSLVGAGLLAAGASAFLTVRAATSDARLSPEETERNAALSRLSLVGSGVLLTTGGVFLFHADL